MELIAIVYILKYLSAFCFYMNLLTVMRVNDSHPLWYQNNFLVSLNKYYSFNLFLLNMDIVSILNFLPFLIDIMKFKSLNDLVLLHCSNANEVLWMQKKFSESHIKTTFFNINQNDSLFIPTTNSKVGIFLNGYCHGWSEVFMKCDLQNIFQTDYVWFIILPNLEFVNDLFQYPIDLNSDVTIINRNNKVFGLHEIYNTGFYSEGVYKVNKVGYWDSVLYYKKKRRTDMTGVIIRCPLVLTERIVDETYVHHFSNRYIGDSMNKMKSYELILYLRDMYNHTYILQRVNSWGYERNGTYDGIVGALHRNESDFGGSCMFIRPDRARYVEYIAETYPSKQFFIFRHPQHPVGFYSIYTRPLTAKVWYCILGIIGVATCTMCLMLKMKSENGYDSSISLAFLFAWSANCQQGMTIQRNSTSVKILIFVILVYSLTIYQYYNAVVVSSLLRDPPKNIKTLEELLRSNLKAGVQEYVYARDYFKHTTDPTALQFYHKKILPRDWMTAEEGMALVQKGGYAFHVDAVVAYRIMRKTFAEREICEAQEVLMYPQQKMGVTTRKRSPYKENFTYGVRKMLESGLMARIASIFDEPKPRCIKTPDSSAITVSLREFSMPLIILILGVFMSIFVLIGEIIMYRMESYISIFRV